MINSLFYLLYEALRYLSNINGLVLWTGSYCRKITDLVFLFSVLENTGDQDPFIH
jgi:hypothetical protein